MMTKSLTACFAIATTTIALLGGCSKPVSEAGATSSTTTAATPAATAEPTTTPPAAPSDPQAFANASLSLGERLARERGSRPRGTPRVEDVLAAISQSGVQSGDQRQYLAATVGARYCAGVHTAHEVTVSVCEYADEASAAAGREMSLKTFPGIKHKDIFVNKATTMTTVQPAATPEQADDVKRAASALARL